MEANKELILFTVIASSAVVLLLIAIVFDIILLYRKRKTIARQEIEIREKKIDELIRKQELNSVNALLQGQNEERRRISRELHDRLGSILFTAKLYNRNIETKLSEIAREQEEGFEKLTHLLDEAVEEVRNISHDLYEGSLANFGFSVALKQLIAALEETNEIEIGFDTEASTSEIDVEIQQQLYAITQEMLSNTLKHARATKVEITLNAGETIEFTYRDNGIGFLPDADTKGIGLENIKERVENINGELKLETAPNQGTFYYISVDNRNEDPD